MLDAQSRKLVVVGDGAGQDGRGDVEWYNVALPVPELMLFYLLLWHFAQVVVWVRRGCRIAPALTFFRHKVFYSWLGVASKAHWCNVHPSRFPLSILDCLLLRLLRDYCTTASLV